ncbi:MAG: response regulator, partial [Zoogloea sp.]|nr:response regulator [Zoogloea sp.]
MRILIVEDDPLLADGVAQLLRGAGFTTDYVGSAELAEAALAAEKFDLMVLDIGLPGMDGLELLSRLRSRHNPIHVLMLTARDALNERVRGLNLGADDYLTKPFAAVELLARINALVRRSRGQSGQRREFGPLSLDEEAHRAWLHGQPLDLPQREWAILQFLL